MVAPLGKAGCSSVPGSALAVNTAISQLAPCCRGPRTPDSTALPFLLGAGGFVSPTAPGLVWRRSPLCSTHTVTGEKGLRGSSAPSYRLGWGRGPWWGWVDALAARGLSCPRCCSSQAPCLQCDRGTPCLTLELPGQSRSWAGQSTAPVCSWETGVQRLPVGIPDRFSAPSLQGCVPRGGPGLRVPPLQADGRWRVGRGL